MTTKLTLTIDEQIIAQAKEYAKSQGRSLSKLIENYLRSVTAENYSQEDISSPIVNELHGSLKVPQDFDYKEALKEALNEKYLNDEKSTD